MFVTYKPENETEQTWDFDPDRVRAAEAELIEKRAGVAFDQWKAGLLQGQTRARRVLLWHLIRRDGHVLRYEDTPDFMAGELLVELSVAEIVKMREGIEKATKLDDDTREQMLAGLEVALTDAMAREGLTEAPKAP